MANVLLLNGPNLNLLGEREPEHYGHDSLQQLEKRLTEQAKSLGHTLTSFQNNHEGALIDRMHQARKDGTAFLLFNPGGYTHTSVALRDALAAVRLPFIEVHVSNTHARETFRHHSYFSDLAVGVITGLGTQGYEFALQAADRYLHAHPKEPGLT
ncbi:MAG: type II 3-dehydroquinate dehydratase [Gammaproteobacteria bacterium]